MYTRVLTDGPRSGTGGAAGYSVSTVAGTGDNMTSGARKQSMRAVLAVQSSHRGVCWEAGGSPKRW